MPKNNFSKKLIFAVAMLTFLIFSAQVFCQSPDGSLTGVVKDPGEAIVKGALVTMVNKDTDNTIIRSTNDSGRYSFLGLQPGDYALTVEMEGFKTWEKALHIGAASQDVLNIQLSIKPREDVVKVVADTEIAQEAFSVGPSTVEVIDEKYIQDLPIITNNVIDVVRVMGGVQAAAGSNADPERLNDVMLMGTPASGVQIIRDGININDVRYESGLSTPSHIGIDTVDEFKVVLSPADAEYGRGGPQIIINSRTGGNQFRGAINYNGSGNFLNSGWGRRNFLNSRNRDHNYSASFSGPIIERKLFFYVNFDRRMSRREQDVAPVVLTDCARKGIYRYFEGFENGNASNSMAGFGGAATVNSVHEDGTPYYENPALNGAAFRMESVFGVLDTQTRALLEQDPDNCSTYDPYTNLGIATYWETGTSSPGLRQLDMLTVPRFSYMMPPANNWGLQSQGVFGFSMYDSAANAGDGLNTAIHKWTRVTTGTGSIYSSLFGFNPERKTLNTNVNWNMSDRHRMSVNYMIEFQGGVNTSRNWDGSPDSHFYAGEGQAIRRPQQIGVNLTSTLRPNMLNELRAGLARQVAHQYSPMSDPDSGAGIKAMLEWLVPTDNFPYYKGLPLLVGLGPEAPRNTTTLGVNYQTATPSSFTFSPQGSGAYNFSMGGTTQAAGSHPYGSVNNGLLPTFGGFDHRWTFTDNFTWMHGAHAIRVGGDIRLARSYQENEGTTGRRSGTGFSSQSYNALTFPVAFGGISQYSLPNWEYPTDIGLVGDQMIFSLQRGGEIINSSTGTYAGMLDLLTYMSGSLSEIRQQYFVNDPFQRTWNDALNANELIQIVDMRQKEISFFAKDDWRVSPTLTVNLGVRWEYYGSPWLANGMTVGLRGGGMSMLGLTGRKFDDWMPAEPRQRADSYLTQQIFIGPDSPNPDAKLYNLDLNNFGPAVGFSWQLPWFGRGRTILRAGYQLSYRTIGNANGYGDSIANEPGTTYNQYYRGSTSDTYLSVANLGDHLPANRFLDPSIVPLDVLKVTERGQDYTGYDTNIRTPYTHNINLSLTRVISNNISVDLRYVGTLARKGVGDIDFNTPNAFRNKELFEAFTAVRRGEESELFDRMFNGFQFGQTQNWEPVGAPGGLTGAGLLRTIYASQIANGDFATVATSLANLNYDKEVSAYADQSVHYINQDYPDLDPGIQGAVLRANGFPENYILGNPQVARANYRGNFIKSNYHSFQAQIQLRPTRGLMLTSTYTFARQFAHQPGGTRFRWFGGNTNWTDPLNRDLDYNKLSYGREHQWNNYGSMEIPIGQNGYFMRGLQNMWLRRLLEGWQFSWTMQMQSGAPAQVNGTTNHLYSNATLMDLAPIMDPELNPTQDPKIGLELASKLAPGDGHLEFPAGSNTGYYYPGGVTPSKYIVGADPQCSDGTVSADLNCTLQGLYLALPDGAGGSLPYADNEAQYANRLILKTSLPGTQGNFRRFISGVGDFSLDMAMIKNLMITEGKSVQIRMQATNVLNHPSPCGNARGGGSNSCPTLNLGGGFGTAQEFGTVNYGGLYNGWGFGERQFQGNFRLLF